ncbi:BCCT family transporter [Granulosicoccaceae sp. 1_MG-2023]|nr:BCCT family transporter [Granulosicoccaceae sp. 1_MG-2023]
MNKIRKIPTVLPFGILFIGIIANLWDEEKYQSVILSINNWVIDTFGWLLSISSVLFVFTCAVAYFSSIGHVRIGGENAKPLLSRLNWFSITLCTTVAVGLLFWSTAEPIYHVYEPPVSLGIEPNTDAARKFAFSTLYLHWSITPYAIYCIPALVFALAFYNMRKEKSIGGLLSPLFGRFTQGVWGQLIDAIALFSLIAGVSSGLGQGLLTLAGGINKFVGVGSSPLVLAFIAALIVATVVASAVSGLMKGIRILSDLNLKFFIGLLVFVLVFGPTGYSLSAGVDGFGDYTANFFSKSFFTGELGNDDWPKWWTNFYWAQWLTWAPVTALFLGHISRGYTVREFILTVMVFPALFSILWMTVFGGMSIYLDEVSGGAIKQTMDQNGIESIIYYIFDQLPISSLITIAFIVIAFVSFVTAADSSIEAIATVCLEGEESEGMDSRSKTTFWLKVVIASAIGFVAWSMTSFAGIKGVKILANLGMLPSLIIVLGAMFTLWSMIAKYTRLYRPETPELTETLAEEKEPAAAPVPAQIVIQES